MNKYLIKLANHLDKKGLHKEADYVDWIVKQSFLGLGGKKYGKDQITAKQIKQKAVELYKAWKARVGDAAHQTVSFLNDPGLLRFVEGMGLDTQGSRSDASEYSEVMDLITKATEKL